MLNLIIDFITSTNTLQPYISLHILHTVPYTFTMVLTRRIFNNHEHLYLVTISFILVTLMCDSGAML